LTEEDILERLRSAETKLAVLEQSQKVNRRDIDAMKSGIGRGLWIIGGGFISSVVAWIAGGGLGR